MADINSNLPVIDTADGSVTPGTAATNSTLMGGQFNTALPTLTNTQQAALQVDSSGRLITANEAFSYFHPVYTTKVQSVGNSNSVNSTTLVTTITATQLGSLIVVCAGSQSGTLTCTDSAAQTYTSAVTVADGGGTPHHNYIFYKANSASGVTTVTITDGTSTALNMIVSEYANITVTPLDKTASNNGSASTSFTSTSTATTTQANELLIGCAYDIAKNNVTFLPGSKWTAAASTQNGVGAAGGTLFQEEQYVSSTGAYAATGTISSSDAYLATIATFNISSFPTGFTIPGTATLIKSGAGSLSTVSINSLGTGAATATFYDNTTNSGRIIAVVSLITNVTSLVYNLQFTTGLTMVTTTNTGDFTVTYS